MDPTLSKINLHRALQRTIRNRKLRLSIQASRLLSSLVGLASETLADEPSLLLSSQLEPDTPEQAAAVAMQSFASLLSAAQLIATHRKASSAQDKFGSTIRRKKRVTIEEADIRMALRHLCPLWPFC
jgi:histone H3/H4